ncbi:MAG: dihydropteroate synthase [bacterium]|nr:MAG: dihydropteroate synthase [bacterium]
MASKIMGIVNVTTDSFSDGGKYLDPDRAVRKSLDLTGEGASIIDLGGESSHPDSVNISAEEEIERLTPIIKALKQENIIISVDTYKPKVMKEVLELGVDIINDITGLDDEESIAIIKDYQPTIVLMFSAYSQGRANKNQWYKEDPVGEILSFFEEKLQQLESHGIKSEKVILDPGMGFFLGANPRPSLEVLSKLSEFKRLGQRILMSTSRKSFIGSVLKNKVSERRAGTLATEIWATLQGVDFIRTHDVKALSDAIKMIQAIQNPGLYH